MTPPEAAAWRSERLHADVSELELLGHVHVLRGAQVSRHAFDVAAGLESMVLVDAEIQGQVRLALERGRAAGSAGPVTGRLFGDALTSGGRVRSRTALGRGGASVSSVAVELARDAAGSLAGRRVLVVGAGQSGALSARALADEGMEVIVAGPHRSHAADVAGTLGRAATSPASSASSSAPTSSSPRPPRPTASASESSPARSCAACCTSRPATALRRRGRHDRRARALRARGLPERGAGCRGLAQARPGVVTTCPR